MKTLRELMAVSEDNYKHIEFERRGSVALIKLNRPAAMNAFTGQMGEEWSAAYRECDRNDAIRAVLLTGNGRAFCAGADMSAAENTFASPDVAHFSTCPVKPAWEVRKPVVAALNGHAIGLGLSLALQCDFRVVARDAKYGLLQVRRGVPADACMHWLLPRLAGQAVATELLLLGRTYNGDQLYEKGLATSVEDNDQVFSVALALAQELALNCAPLVVGLSKQLLWDSAKMSLAEMETKETRWLQHCMGQPDAIEGGRAYALRREPQWQGSVVRDWPEE